MSKRHAQEYWLKRQADRAVKRAMSEPSEKFADEVRKEIMITSLAWGEGLNGGVLRGQYDHAISELARLCVYAEMLNRELVRRGGQPL